MHWELLMKMTQKSWSHATDMHKYHSGKIPMTNLSFTWLFVEIWQFKAQEANFTLWVDSDLTSAAFMTHVHTWIACDAMDRDMLSQD